MSNNIIFVDLNDIKVKLEKSVLTNILETFKEI